MGRVIGFVDFPKAWEGPAILEFALASEHTKTARYKCQLEERVFDLYAPLFILPDPSVPANRILVALGKARGTIQTIGFCGESKPLMVGSQICEFEFNRDMINSKRYVHLHDAQRYYLSSERNVQERLSANSRVSSGGRR